MMTTDLALNFESSIFEQDIDKSGADTELRAAPGEDMSQTLETQLCHFLSCCVQWQLDLRTILPVIG